MPNPTLRRLLVERPVELRAAPEGSNSPGVLFGYALTYNEMSRDLGGWREVIDPACFAESIARGDRVMCRAEHDSRLLLGTTDAETLRVKSDDVGVFYEVELPNTNAGRDVAVLAARGDYRFSSFAFYEHDGHWEPYEMTDGDLVWRATRGTLVDCAPVADPAYWSSSVAKRDLDAATAALTHPPTDSGDADVALREAQTTAARLRLLNLHLEKGTIHA